MVTIGISAEHIACDEVDLLKFVIFLNDELIKRGLEIRAEVGDRGPWATELVVSSEFDDAWDTAFDRAILS